MTSLFQLLNSKTLFEVSLTSLFVSRAASGPSGNLIGSVFKIYLKIQLLYNTSLMLSWFKFLLFLCWLVHLPPNLSFCFYTWSLADCSHLSRPSNPLKTKLVYLTPLLILFSLSLSLYIYIYYFFFFVSKWKRKPYKSLQNTMPSGTLGFVC